MHYSARRCLLAMVNHSGGRGDARRSAVITDMPRHTRRAHGHGAPWPRR